MLIKGPSILDANLPLHLQLQTLALPTFKADSLNTNPYEALHSLVHLALGPYFEASSQQANSTLESTAQKTYNDKESIGAIPTTRRKIAELELSLLHLQQNIEIPELNLNFHPIVDSALEKDPNVDLSIDLIPAKYLNDTDFLNALQSNVNGWIKSIQGITRMSRDPENGTAAQEINFWLSMETALKHIENQLEGPGVTLTLNILRNAKRFHATVSFLSDTGIKEATDKISKYNQLMRDFPLDDLISATSLGGVQKALLAIFAHLNKKLRITPYPVKRALALVEAISEDVNNSLVRILDNIGLLQLDYPAFVETTNAADDVWTAWKDQLVSFTTLSRDIIKKRSQKFIPLKIISKNLMKTKERMEYLKVFRNRHQTLCDTIVKVLGRNTPLKGSKIGFDGIDPLQDINEAYNVMRSVDALDTSEDGVYKWNKTERDYNERITRVENSIIVLLRERLAAANTSNEMFRVFSKFNALFVRPSIRGAIQEYQSRLIENVKNDISALQEKFRLQYSNSEAYEMSKLRDIPPVSGTIIWIRQIERQLDNYMKKVEAVLGKGWQYYAEGQKLHTESISFRQKLDTTPIYETWLANMSKRTLTINGLLFRINKNRKSDGSNVVFELTVNFDPQVITLFKEVRNLSWLKYQVPHSLSSVGKDAQRVYPYAVDLIDSLKTLNRTYSLISEQESTRDLLNGYENGIYKLLEKGFTFSWESFVHVYDVKYDRLLSENRHVKFVQEFEKSVKVFDAKAKDLYNINRDISGALATIKNCMFNFDSFASSLKIIQEAVDKLNLEGYVNVGEFVESLNHDIKLALIQRCRDIIQSWINTFDKPDGEQNVAVPNYMNIHELTLKNRVISLYPPLESTRCNWLNNFQENIENVSRLPKILPNRFDIKLAVNQHDELSESDTFRDIADSMTEEVGKVLNLIDFHIGRAESYLDNWYQFQALWDLEGSQVYDYLGTDMAKWLQILNEIRKARTTFDTTDGFKTFGLLKIDFRTVQVRINAKYDGWQHDIIQKFSQCLNTSMKDLCGDMENLRRDLEQQSSDAFATDQVVSTVTKVQSCTQFLTDRENDVNLFRNGQATLSRYRFRFPSNWLFIDQVENELAALKEILSKRSAVIESQIDGIRARVQSEMKRLQDRSSSLEAQWEQEKPVSGAIKPKDALKLLSRFESDTSSLLDSSTLLRKASVALDLDFNLESNLDTVLEEIRDFNSVWAALESIWNALEDLRDNTWASVVPRKIRKSLEDLIEVTKGMPTRIRQYAAFDHIQTVLKTLIKSQSIIIDLKTEAIHERHWQKLFKALSKHKQLFYNNLSLGDVWDMNLIANSSFIKDIVTEAQGELALEIFLRQVRSTWSNYTLELTNYKTSCRLIKGWDELFQTCSDHLNSLGAMHHSHYFKVFEEEARGWEDKLNRIHVLFDVWIDVQRQWVYLEGVFNNNSEIKNILPVESSRFQSLNSEFFVILRKVYKSPLILDVLNIPGIQQSIERLADLLAKVQKALGEFYEQERQRFARLYFIGDEDLLEIIGNSDDVHRVEKHLGKMFAGVSSLIYDEENSTIDGVCSKEGEEVLLSNRINLVKTPNVVEWLIKLNNEIKISLSDQMKESLDVLTNILSEESLVSKKIMIWIQKFPSQVSLVSSQILWTRKVENAFKNNESLDSTLESYSELLRIMANFVLQELSIVDRKKCENLITELIHQRDVIATMIAANTSSLTDFIWQSQLTYYFDSTASPTERLTVNQANSVFTYGFEYLGMPDRLVSTPLVDKFFLAMTQALEQKLGGSPFGPAGTGKTESVKALGQNLGKFVLVFCCDESFDFQAIGRILAGVCQVNAWACFDEFNRLNEQILSAVSMQIEAIELGIKVSKDSNSKSEVVLANRKITLNDETGIFITMNPEYAGRNSLPENLKKLFRSFSMAKPDKEIIAEVILNSQGFVHAKKLSQIVVPFFTELHNNLSEQVHYDFGLRALKNVLVTSGSLKRLQLESSNAADIESWETSIILQSLRETVAPKLLAQDAKIMLSIEKALFPEVEYKPFHSADLEQSIISHATKQGYVVSDEWLTKVFQLYQFQKIHHGIMLVGSSGYGKSGVYQILLKAMQDVDQTECVHHLIDAKVMSKEHLFGSLDSTTREWTDGLFTAILRKIVDNLRGENQKMHWIIFDGDVDPEWAENLNSVLDDNKHLTLPNGERIALPDNVRIAFEVENLDYATPATVSRCGMIWFGSSIVTSKMKFNQLLYDLRQNRYDDVEEDLTSSHLNIESVQNLVCDHIAELFDEVDIENLLSVSKELNHIMEFTEIRALNSLFCLINSACLKLLLFMNQHPDYSPSSEQQRNYITKSVLLCLTWAFSGDCSLKQREEFGAKLLLIPQFANFDLDHGQNLIDYDVSLPEATWEKWENKVPRVELDAHSIIKTDVVIPTTDTMRHESLIYGLLNSHKPIVLCGPPGSGKTMTLFNALRNSPNLDVVGLNFSKATTPNLLIKSLEQHCEYKKTVNGTVLSPSQIGRWLVVFCDEINLPATDKYGTQTAISLLRQMIEQKGFWSPSQNQWVTLSRIQFVGACNPPTDVGRNTLSLRFLRHSAVILVDYPGEMSLHQIYESFNSAILKSVPSLRGYAQTLTSAMIEFYLKSQDRFSESVQTHYIYSPRELTRWVRGIYEAIHPLDILPIDGLVRIWAHEALRLFHDRLAYDEERSWTIGLLRDVASKHFLNVDLQSALQMPILYSNWLTKDYLSVEKDRLKEFVKARMRTFCDEDLDKPLILYDDLLDHVLRIDRVLRQPQGHLILIGVSGSGKSTLSRFVAWMNGIKVVQLKTTRKYSQEEFDSDLRSVLRRVGTNGEKICFLLDESNILETAFLERMNTLLANGEVPGLFEGDDYTTLMTACKEGALRQGHNLDTQDELYKWFTSEIVKNLHVIFTMNPPDSDLSSHSVASPALFNRCVLNWMGNWSDKTLLQVASNITDYLDLNRSSFEPPQSLKPVSTLFPVESYRSAIVNSMVCIHKSAIEKSISPGVNEKRLVISPGDFLDYLHHVVSIFHEKNEELEDQQRHFNVGLDKLKETVLKVKELKNNLAEKKSQLENKSQEAKDMLKQMISDQSEAERKREASIEIQNALKVQEREISERQEIVLHDLSRAEPAVIEAQKSVSNIKKQHLTELRSMVNPPQTVKLALDSVCTLLGYRAGSWKEIQSYVRRDDFISNIVNFDSETQMTAQLRAKMENEFLSLPNFNFETVNRASKACGPLLQWVEAQVAYSSILERVGPLREEVSSLKQGSLETRAQAQAIIDMIDELEASIEKYKEDYAQLITETQSIKAEMTIVENKVNRSVNLLDSLSDERNRWSANIKEFEYRKDSLPGDILLSAAFISYSGFYDQNIRSQLYAQWSKVLSDSGITFQKGNSISDYLATGEQRLLWHNSSLPPDDLCVENAIMLTRYSRYPFIIDPTARVIPFLESQYSKKKLTVTSFLDDAFIKHLESSIRFGNPILIQDAEYLDPVLSQVLNKEYKHTGGRTLVELGNQDIDFSKDFKLYLMTRDPSIAIAPHISCRTTVVNFTITRSSLASQALNQVLQAERPEVEEKRLSLIKLHGEYKVHLRQLETNLLHALNDSEGNILDHDGIIDTLEKLKVEAAEVTKKVDETDAVMETIETVMHEYRPLADHCGKVFSIIDKLFLINNFYQFSLEYFLSIFSKVLQHVSDSTLSSVSRVNQLISILYHDTYQKIALSLLNKDRPVFLLLLAQALSPVVSSDILEKILKVPAVKNTDHSLPGWFSKIANVLDEFGPLNSATDEKSLISILSKDKPELFIPRLWDDSVPGKFSFLKLFYLFSHC